MEGVRGMYLVAVLDLVPLASSVVHDTWCRGALCRAFRLPSDWADMWV